MKNEGREAGGSVAVSVGDTVRRLPITFREYDAGEKRHPMKGRVMYIHPDGRYHTVEFETPGGLIRESFLGVNQ